MKMRFRCDSHVQDVEPVLTDEGLLYELPLIFHESPFCIVRPMYKLDVNGVELYEGDIVSKQNYGKNGKKNGKFYKLCAIIDGNPNLTRGDWKFEGNIWDNPEYSDYKFIKKTMDKINF